MDHYAVLFYSLPASFQRAVDIILTKYYLLNVLAYIDDIIIFSSSMEERIRQVYRILDMLRNPDVPLIL